MIAREKRKKDEKGGKEIRKRKSHLEQIYKLNRENKKEKEKRK